MNSFSISFKAFALVALFSAFTLNAMKTPAAPAPVANPAPAGKVEPIAPANKAKDCGISCNISKAWNDFSKAVVTQKNNIIDRAKEMKTRGWSQWEPKEKAGVVIGGVAVAGLTAYLVYKVYKSFTCPKVKKAPRA
jgi:hypothetical protein